MSNPHAEQQDRRIQADQEELSQRIARILPHDGVAEPQPNLHFVRLSSPGERLYAVCEPSFCVIAQGSKDITLGADTFRYDPSHYLISTMELPLSGKVVEASTERPYLSFRLVLDPSIVTSVMVESGFVQPNGDSNVKAVDVSSLDADLLDATVRLVRLTETSDRIPGTRSACHPGDSLSAPRRRTGQSYASPCQVRWPRPSDGSRYRDNPQELRQAAADR